MQRTRPRGTGTACHRNASGSGPAGRRARRAANAPGRRRAGTHPPGAGTRRPGVGRAEARPAGARTRGSRKRARRLQELKQEPGAAQARRQNAPGTQAPRHARRSAPRQPNSRRPQPDPAPPPSAAQPEPKRTADTTRARPEPPSPRPHSQPDPAPRPAPRAQRQARQPTARPDPPARPAERKPTPQPDPGTAPGSSAARGHTCARRRTGTRARRAAKARPPSARRSPRNAGSPLFRRLPRTGRPARNAPAKTPTQPKTGPAKRPSRAQVAARPRRHPTRRPASPSRACGKGRAGAVTGARRSLRRRPSWWPPGGWYSIGRRSHSSHAATHSPKLTRAQITAATRNQAAAWVAQQVEPQRSVSCDPVDVPGAHGTRGSRARPARAGAAGARLPWLPGRRRDRGHPEPVRQPSQFRLRARSDRELRLREGADRRPDDRTRAELPHSGRSSRADQQQRKTDGDRALEQPGEHRDFDTGPASS